MTISKTKLGIFLGAVLGVLGLIHIAMVFSGQQDEELLSIFRMDFEASLLTWYSAVILLFVSAVLAFYIGWSKRKVGAKFANHWIVLSGLLLFLSIDDGAMVHEKISTVSSMIGLQDILNSISAELFAWSWWVIYLPIFALICVFLIRWFVTLPLRTKLLFALAVLLVGVGQIGLEAFSSYLNATSGYDVFWRGIEKLVGRAGLSVLLFAIVDYIGLMPSSERQDIKLKIVR